ncbi:FxLYD domain-containing protein [Streptomyces sp. CA-250714]|uniref:FxLYD domain-containing protein n=1 Tax=Streptomyces sp. CA-250714 TaxID=3240060 RepID=UPI003D8B0065
MKITKSGVENHDVWKPNAYVVRYMITNNGDGPADYFAQFEFLDKYGDVLGSTGVTADKLGPGKSRTADTAPVKEEIENGTMTDIKNVRVTEVDRTPN